jgi:hypothetical protein
MPKPKKKKRKKREPAVAFFTKGSGKSRKVIPITAKEMKQIQRTHDERTSHAQRIDESLTAKPPSSAGDWLANPNRRDVVGVDYPERRKKSPVKKPKFKMGDMVYSWQNPTVKGRVLRVIENEPPYENKYVLRLKREDGSTYNSKFISESSISKGGLEGDIRKAKKKLIARAKRMNEKNESMSETFGQREVREVKDRYNLTPYSKDWKHIQDFDEWLSGFTFAWLGKRA